MENKITGNEFGLFDYLEYAKSWQKNGAQIIGGCCGLGVEEIKAISVLKE